MHTDSIDAQSGNMPLGEAQDPKPQIQDTRPEASLAPGRGELLSLPFDQYGRMRIAQNVALALHGEIVRQEERSEGERAALRLLDVGGYPGVLRRFLEGVEYDLSVLDVAPDDGTIPGYRQGSGLDLPYEDAAFDVVTGLDTLEHIPHTDRNRFLSELKRVARYAVLLINPVQSLEADLAEETLDEYIRWILDAQQEQLAEHRQYGLPDFDAMAAAFREDGWQTLSFPTANVHNWLFMMVAKHYLISMRDERASAFERTLDRFYNLTFSQDDYAQPAYRGVVVAVRPGLEGALGHIEQLYSPAPAARVPNTERMQLTQLLMSLIDLKVANHEDRLLREQLARRDKHITGMEARISLMEAHIAGREAQIAAREEHIAVRESYIATLEQELQSAQAGQEERSRHFLQYRNNIEAEFARHKPYIERLEEEQRIKDEHILYLEKLLQGIESGRVMRLTRSLSRFLGR